MKKSELNEKVQAVKAETKEALQTAYEALNHGQRKQFMKNEKVKKMFDRYGVEYLNE